MGCLVGKLCLERPDFLLALLHRLGLFCCMRFLGERALAFSVQVEHESQVVFEAINAIDSALDTGTISERVVVYLVGLVCVLGWEWRYAKEHVANVSQFLEEVDRIKYPGVG